MSAQPAGITPERPNAPRARLVKRKSQELIRRRGARRIAPLIVVATIIVGAVLAAVLLEQVVLAQSAFKLQQVQHRLEKQQARQQELLLQAARLESPGRIEQYARMHLGMVDPPPSVVQYIVADVSIRRRTDPVVDPRRGATAAASAEGYLQEAAP